MPATLDNQKKKMRWLLDRVNDPQAHIAEGSCGQQRPRQSPNTLLGPRGYHKCAAAIKSQGRSRPRLNYHLFSKSSPLTTGVHRVESKGPPEVLRSPLWKVHTHSPGKSSRRSTCKAEAKQSKDMILSILDSQPARCQEPTRLQPSKNIRPGKQDWLASLPSTEPSWPRRCVWKCGHCVHPCFCSHHWLIWNMTTQDHAAQSSNLFPPTAYQQAYVPYGTLCPRLRIPFQGIPFQQKYLLSLMTLYFVASQRTTQWVHLSTFQ